MRFDSRPRMKGKGKEKLEFRVSIAPLKEEGKKTGG